MPYFFILPAFALLILVLVALLVGSYLSTRLVALRPHVIGLLLWVTVGFIAANLALLLLLAGVVSLGNRLELAPSTPFAIAVLVLGLPGPFVVSIAGVGMGALLGLKRSGAIVGSRGGLTKS